MIAIRPIANCGPIADCTICARDAEKLTVDFWESSEFAPVKFFTEVDNGTLICVPKDFCGGSVAYAYPLPMPNVSKPYNCSDDNILGSVICAPAHDNIAYAPPCGGVGTRAQWVRETYCCTREAA